MEAQTFSIVPSEKIKKIDLILEMQERILEALSMKATVQQDEHLRVKEFIVQTKMGRTKFERLKSEGKLKTIKLGRIIYIKSSEVERYFNGEIE